MNNERRKRIAAVIDLMTDARSKLDDLLNEERDAYEALPDNLREGSKGEAIETAIDALESAVTNMENDESALEEITGGVRA
jgi:hypothetical protein